MYSKTLCSLYPVLILLPCTLLTQASAAQNATTSVPLPYRIFSKRTICPSSKCNPLETPSRVPSRIGCMAACSQNATCRGASFNQSCFHLDDVCFTTSACQQVNQGAVTLAVYERHQTCLNSGKWNSTSRRCRCSGGWIGSNCEILAKTCRELQVAGYPPDFYHVVLNIRNNTPAVPRKVYCTLGPDNSVLTYMFRSTGKVDHNRTWSDFEEGYVINDGNLWLGLNNMAAVSETSHYDAVGVSVILRSGTHERTYSLVYYDFQIGNSQKQ
ncbi:microfibril-associated glycoprotein 4 [Elysia marginata]|uniref:Microfibril-associated glycoprotein 4 n=1 Tax=Elysia marginata TaxID=1093978 RepID=A0AAV4F0F0_9GAST|nr:microfibril-associated glycoprotein 4 [Elysia marginata]